MEKEIWVLGQNHPDAHKSFNWKQRIPNISDADIIIIDLDTITDGILKDLQDNGSNIGDELKERFSNKGVIVLMLGDTNGNLGKLDSLIPVTFTQYPSNEGRKIKYKQNNRFADYLKNVEKFDYHLRDIKIHEESKYTHRKLEWSITDNSDRVLGGAYILRHNRGGIIGEIILLPPTTSISREDAISKIIDCIDQRRIETPPSWTKKVEIHDLQDVIDDISDLENQKRSLEDAIKKQHAKKEELSQYLGLLYAQGSQLEQIVKNAFRILGFEEIRKDRAPNEEDWLVEFESDTDIKFGLLEVKGHKKKSSQRDILQCEKWVNDYGLMSPSVKTKGIFVSNQFRLDEFPKSRDDRTEHEPNVIKCERSALSHHVSCLSPSIKF